MGPPVTVFFAAISLRDSGSKSPTLLLAGLACPSSQTTPSTSTSQMRAARCRRSSMSFFDALMTARPVARVTRLPPVTPVKPIEAVSATMGRTRS